MLFRTIILAAIALAGGLSQQTPPRDAPVQLARGTGVIAGTLTLGDGNQPARRARITLSGTIRPGRAATSDDNGRFMFAELPAGSYTLQASKPGYLTTYFGAKRSAGAGMPVTVAEGQRVSLAPLALIKGGVITGTVSDPSGQPAPRASVTVFTFSQDTLTGDRTLRPAYFTDSDSGTDDRGMYRAFGLPPGDYLVSVTPSSALPATAMRQLTTAEIQRALLPGVVSNTPAAPVPIQLVNYSRVFHPSATDVSIATIIKLGPSEERTGVDVQMQLVPVATISGALSLPAGVRPTSLEIKLERRGPEGSLLAGIYADPRFVSPAGTFRISNVTPGAYTVKVQPFGSAADTELWGMTDVDVDGRDLTVALSLQPTMTLTAAVSFEGGSDASKDTVGLQLLLQGRNSGGMVTGSRRDPQGRMTVRGVLPGEYRIMCCGAIGSWSLRSILWNGHDLLDEPLVVRPGENPDLKIVFTDRPSELSGVLQDVSGRAAYRLLHRRLHGRSICVASRIQTDPDGQASQRRPLCRDRPAARRLQHRRTHRRRAEPVVRSRVPDAARSIRNQGVDRRRTAAATGSPHRAVIVISCSLDRQPDSRT